MAELDVELVAADRSVWSGSARAVNAPASEGQVGILPGHTPLLALLKEGVVHVTPTSGAALDFTVTGGFLSVDANRVTIVADSVETGRASA